MDWSNVLSRKRAKKQKMYDRCTTAFRMRGLGFLFREIAEHLKISVEHARNLVNDGKGNFERGVLSPAETEGGIEIILLADKIRKGVTINDTPAMPRKKRRVLK